MGRTWALFDEMSGGVIVVQMRDLFTSKLALLERRIIGQVKQENLLRGSSFPPWQMTHSRQRSCPHTLVPGLPCSRFQQNEQWHNEQWANVTEEEEATHGDQGKLWAGWHREDLSIAEHRPREDVNLNTPYPQQISPTQSYVFCSDSTPHLCLYVCFCFIWFFFYKNQDRPLWQGMSVGRLWGF
jgi:hypothetical protein